MTNYIDSYLARPAGAPLLDGDAVRWHTPPPPAPATDPSRITLVGEVGKHEFTAQALAPKLRAAGRQPVGLHVSSSGGDTDEALKIVALLHAHQRGSGGPVTAHVTEEASSAASLVVQACDRRVVGPHARMLVHAPAASWPARGVPGVTADMLLTAYAEGRLPDEVHPAAAMTIKALRDAGAEVAACYAWRTGRPIAAWREAMAAERVYVGAGIVYACLADEVAW
jgi:ATP-dependent protease ClpP protease subunit